jgi:glutathione S-transferase
MPTLYQFSFSHFCEKARWALDYKGVQYATKNLLPGLHVRVRKKLAVGKTCVPILVEDDGTVIQESAAIIDHLDTKHASDPLTPRDPNLAEQAREWEAYLDDEIGVTLRALFYYHALPMRRTALTFLLHEGPWYGQPLFALIFPKVRDAMIEMMDINENTAKDSERRLFDAVTRLNSGVKDRKFLVGDSFTRADLTACALLEHLCKPIEKFEAVFPTPFRGLQEQYRDQPFFSWVNDIYREQRRNSI